jgi:dipeptidyl aminopeptidase/acylaminoacyl peptidase
VPPYDVPWAFNLGFSRDDTMLAVAYDEPAALVWNTETGEVLREVEHGGSVSDVDFSEDGTRLVTGGREGLVKVWDTESWASTGTFRGHTDAVTDVEVSSDRRVASGGTVADVFVWDYDTFEIAHSVVGHDGDVDGIDISPDGRYLVTGSWTDTTTRLWDISPTWSRELSSVPGQVSVVSGEGAVSFSPDGRNIAASTSEGLVAVWDPVDGTEISTMSGPGSGALWAVDHTSDGRLVAAAGAEGARVWDLESGDVVRTLFDRFRPLLERFLRPRREVSGRAQRQRIGASVHARSRRVGRRIRHAAHPQLDRRRMCAVPPHVRVRVKIPRTIAAGTSRRTSPTPMPRGPTCRISRRRACLEPREIGGPDGIRRCRRS